MKTLDAEGRASVDHALRQWRQGDCVVGEHWFVFRIAPSAPITPEATDAAAAGAQNAETEVAGLVVVSQTCDVVRECESRPFIELCPLVQVDDDRLSEIKRYRRPRYAYVPGVADRYLVADLDRVMTVEKAVVSEWNRVPGCTSSNEMRQFARALSRKRVRAAFPDDFSDAVGSLRNHISRKHTNNSEAGQALRALQEIRVTASPSWDAEKIELFFWFIRDEDKANFEGKGWDHFLEKWLGFVKCGEHYTSVKGVVFTLNDMTAREYVDSALLDLDDISPPTVQLAATPKTRAPLKSHH